MIVPRHVESSNRQYKVATTIAFISFNFHSFHFITIFPQRQDSSSKWKASINTHRYDQNCGHLESSNRQYKVATTIAFISFNFHSFHFITIFPQRKDSSSKWKASINTHRYDQNCGHLESSNRQYKVATTIAFISFNFHSFHFITIFPQRKDSSSKWKALINTHRYDQNCETYQCPGQG
eukprot:TRINITY_DN4685_c2_g2_i2.p1 TRINITY_DN4685_c2_g2~~TRINITY_DN4685_c2_g2_i2.p1  ORF type:complete len:179 (+),score=10.71 TRINITY_DN4685_c2_g2_i2:1031-1567(+)